jgi:hypothetical protein
MNTERTFCLSRPAKALSIGFVVLIGFFLVNLYVANQGNGTIEKFDSSGNGSVFGNPWGLYKLNGPPFDSSGNLYKATWQGIYKLDPNGHPSRFDNGLVGVGGTTGIAVQVPEPSTWLLLALGIGAVLGGLRLRRRSS